MLKVLLWTILAIFQLLIISLDSNQFVLSQNSKWSFDTSIQTAKYYELKGAIDGKYPISMYWKYTYGECSEYPNKFTPKLIAGWYQYDKIGKRIPLVGQISNGDSSGEYLTLFVPESAINYKFNNNCEIEAYKEIFKVEKCCEMEKMTWQIKGKEALPVTMEITHDFSYITQTDIQFYINGIQLKSIDVTTKSGLSYIDYIDILGEKEIDGEYHLLFGFGYNSMPGSRGWGMCGAGVEGYIGYLKLAKDFDVETFTFIQNESCLRDVEDIEVVYDEKNPEKGIKKVNR